MYTYQWYQWLLFFYTYCFLGWVFESSYVSICTRKPVNRGFLRGPMLPIYGSGAIIVLGATIPIRGNNAAVYFAGAAAATILEYVTGWMMERLFKVKYWDYSNQKLNLHGYICLSSTIAWGFFSLLLVNVIHRPIESLILALLPAVAISSALFFTVIFLSDFVLSFRSARELGQLLERLTAVRAELEEIQVQLALLKAEASDQMEQLRTTLEHKAAMARCEASLRLDDMKVMAKAYAPSQFTDMARRSSRLLDFLNEEADNFRSDLNLHSRILSERFSQLSDAMKVPLDDARQKFEQQHNDSVVRLTELRTKLAALRESRKKASAGKFAEFSGILHRNPSASSRFADALKEIREWNDNNPDNLM